MMKGLSMVSTSPKGLKFHPGGTLKRTPGDGGVTTKRHLNDTDGPRGVRVRGRPW